MIDDLRIGWIIDDRIIESSLDHVIIGRGHVIIDRSARPRRK